MQYKTIILELLANQTRNCTSNFARTGCWCRQWNLAPCAEDSSRSVEGATGHEKAGNRPESDRDRAMEIAVQEMESRLQAAFPPDRQGPLSLDDAEAFIRNLTSRD